MLQANFGARWATLEGPQAWSVVTSDEVGAFLREHPEICALSSHQARQPPPRSDYFRVFPIVVLRHPIDRIESVYLQDKWNAQNGHEPRVALNYDLAEYVEWRLDKHDPVIRNFQVVSLSNAHETAEDLRTVTAKGDHLDQARRLLRELPAFGIVEWFAESVRQWQDCLQPFFPSLCLIVKHENRSPTRANRLGERVDAARALLGEDLYGQLLAANEYDLELYEYARSLFLARSAAGSMVASGE
jgi:hypothetical protein